MKNKTKMKNKKGITTINWINCLSGNILLLFTLFILFNCNTNLNEEIVLNSENQTAYTIDPIEAIKELKEISGKNKSQEYKTSKLTEEILNHINAEILARKTISKNGVKRYSFALQGLEKNNKKTPRIYYDDLFVNIDKKNNVRYHVMRYIPSEEWFYSSRDESKFTGTVQYLSLTRDVISSLEMKDGEQVKGSSEKTQVIQARGGCQLIFKLRVCGGLEGDRIVCESFYELSCGGGSSGSGSTGNGGSTGGGGFSDPGNGDSGNNNGGFGNDNDSTGGGGSNGNNNDDGSGGDGFGGDSILGRCPEGTLIDPITGYCVVEEAFGSSCKSFDFKTTTSSWQEASIVNMRFNIVLIEIVGGIKVKKIIPLSFPQPVRFGMPRKFKNDTKIPPGLAAEISARAINHAIDDTLSKYSSLVLNSTDIIRSYFQDRLKLHFKDYSNGGRINFNDMSSINKATQYITYGFFKDNCY